MRLFQRLVLTSVMSAGLAGSALAIEQCRPAATAPPMPAAVFRATALRYQAEFEAEDYQAAFADAQSLEAAMRTQLGTHNMFYAVALRDLAEACDWLYGSLDETEAMYKQALAIAHELSQANQTNDAGTLDRLGALYNRHGRLVEAEQMYKLAEQMYERDRDVDHAANALNNLAAVYLKQARYEEAERLYKLVLPIKEKVRDPSHAAVGTVLNNLAKTYASAGRYAEAEALYQRVMSISGANDRAYLGNFGELLAAQGRYPEAEKIYRRSLALSPSTGVMALLGIMQEQEGHYAEAEATLKEALPTLEGSHADEDFVAEVLDHLGAALRALGRYSEAEPSLKRALAIREPLLGTNHPDVAGTLDNLAMLYAASGDDKSALAYSRRASASVVARVATEGSGRLDMSNGLVIARAGYFRHHVANLAVAARKGFEPLPALRGEALEVAQWAVQSTTAAAVEQMALRFASGDSALGTLVRERQDLAGLIRANNMQLVEALSRPESQRNQAVIDDIRRQMAQTENRLAELSARLEKEFPDYAALANPKPLKGEEVQKLLGADEALVSILVGDTESYVFALTRDGFDWKTIPLGASAMADKVVVFRRGLSVEAITRDHRDLFDLGRAYELYQALLGPVDALIKDKHHLLIVPSGALTALPFHLLVTERPSVSVPQIEDQITVETLAPYRAASWLIKRQAVTVLPAVASLKALRVFARKDEGTKPMIGFADPVFNAQVERAETRTAQVRGVTRSYTEFWNGASIDRTELAKALPRLADTADEVKTVASSLGAPAGDIYLREAASETNVKRAALSDYRIVYFATHGLVAGDVKGLAEPSLALSLPRQPSDFDDGLLTASEVAQLKLNADWVVLSACNTIAGDKPGAEALSGLARAFFYAGARALLVSHWSVASHAATQLTTATFDLLHNDPKLGRAEALRRAELAYLADTSVAINAYPAFWAPFEIVGEGGGR